MDGKDINSPYARQLNSIFFRVGVSEEAKKQLIPENMEKMKKEFQYMIPYVQSIILQSVIYLTSEQFSQIEKDYRELIVIAQSSNDKWVKNISNKFQNYPDFSNLNQTEESDQLNYSGLSSFVVNNSNIENLVSDPQTDLSKLNSNSNYRINSVDPPSKSFQPKSLSSVQKEQISSEHFYSAPPKRNAQPVQAPKPSPASIPTNLPPREPKKEKVVHSVDELRSKYFPANDTKKKTQLTLFHAFNS